MLEIVIMNRDRRKLSRSLEERGTLVSLTRSTQLSQKDNELKQKLDAIDTSYKLSNKRIKKETRELREILYGFQRELKLSKDMKGAYTPSLLEKPHHGRVRRTTVSSVPSEDRKEVWPERYQDRREMAKHLELSDMERRKSESSPSASPSHVVKTIEDGIAGAKLGDKIRIAQEDELKDNRSPVFAQEIIRDLRAQQPKSSELKTELIFDPERSQTTIWENERGTSRSIVQAGNRRILGHSFTEHQDRRKKYSLDASHSPLSKSFQGRFVTDNETISTGYNRKKSQPQQISEIGMNRQRPNIGEELPSVPKQRKISLNVPLYVRQRKDSNNRGGIPIDHGPTMRLPSNDSSLSAFDSLPENLGGRRMSVAHGRIRKISRATGLPPLEEERSRQQESHVENWSDLAKCRYLRKEENDISIDDIFRKE